MSKAVKSNGEVNAITARLSTILRQKPSTYRQAEADAFLTDDRLKACTLQVLCDIFAAYHAAFGAKNWLIYKHIVIKGEQSKPWRDLRNAAIANDDDPVGSLLVTAPEAAPVAPVATENAGDDNGTPVVVDAPVAKAKVTAAMLERPMANTGGNTDSNDIDALVADITAEEVEA